MLQLVATPALCALLSIVNDPRGNQRSTLSIIYSIHARISTDDFNRWELSKSVVYIRGRVYHSKIANRLGKVNIVGIRVLVDFALCYDRAPKF